MVSRYIPKSSGLFKAGELPECALLGFLPLVDTSFYEIKPFFFPFKATHFSQIASE